MVNSSEITRTIIAATNADSLAKEQVKKELLSQWIENGKKFKFNASKGCLSYGLKKPNALWIKQVHHHETRVQEDDIFRVILSAKIHPIKREFQWKVSMMSGILWLPSTHPALEPISRNPKRKLGIYDVRNTLATQYHPALKPITWNPKRKLGQTLGHTESWMAAIALV